MKSAAMAGEPISALFPGNHEAMTQDQPARAAEGVYELDEAPSLGARTEGEESRGGRAWLFGAYALLIVWGAAYLALFFTDHLPH